VERSAREMGKRDFAIYALGSPTELMETQHFDILVDMIVAAKKALPISKPLHLFGAGHPATFPFFVALGCDLFDSAAYALYAKQDKYFTSEGTLKLDEMEELPCNCTTCRDNTGNSLRELPPEDKEMLLARHNLQVCMSELRKIREMIRAGRLWEMLEIRSHAHPAFKRCFERLAYHTDFLERYSPAVKLHGIFYYGRSTNPRPEIQRYSTKLSSAVEQGARWLVLLPSGWRRPFHQDPGLDPVVRELREMESVSIIFYSLAFGPVPLELDEAYPIPHTDVYDPGSSEEYEGAATKVSEHVKTIGPRHIVLVHGTGPLGKHIETKLRESELSGRLKIVPLKEVVGLIAAESQATF
jgi:7-cyano-7-deazaguanine tRNA-ribosyltransferase